SVLPRRHWRRRLKSLVLTPPLIMTIPSSLLPTPGRTATPLTPTSMSTAATAGVRYLPPKETIRRPQAESIATESRNSEPVMCGQSFPTTAPPGVTLDRGNRLLICAAAQMDQGAVHHA